MSAHEKLEMFDAEWKRCRELVMGPLGLQVRAVRSDMGTEFKYDLPRGIRERVKPLLDRLAAEARAELLQAAKEEARRTLEEIE